jgi:hypothetical protein
LEELLITQPQPTELQSNVTLALAVEQALPAIRELAEQMAPHSEQARILHNRIGAGGGLKEADVTLALSVLAQAIRELRERVAFLEAHSSTR